jgi:predicted nucleic acid-binding protein
VRFTNLDFVHCLLVAHAQRLDGTVVSFDQDFDGIPDVTRQEPLVALKV